MAKLKENVCIDKDCRIFLSTPFWCSYICAGIHPKQRDSHLNSAVNYCNSKDDTPDPWVYRKLFNPRTIRIRKTGFLIKNIELPLSLIEKIKDLLHEDQTVAILGRILYIDYGLGTLELIIDARKNDNESMEHFVKKCAAVKNECVLFLQNGTQGIRPNLATIDDIISGFLLKEGISIENESNMNSGIDNISNVFCGPIARNLIFFDSENINSSYSSSIDELELASNIFINQSSPDFGKTGSLLIPVYHVGFEGGVALIQDKRTSSQRQTSWNMTQCDDPLEWNMLDHLQTLWSWAIVFWAAIFAASEGLFALSAKFSVQKSHSLAKVNKHIEFLDIYRKIISMIKFEARPEKVVVEGEDAIIYKRIWEAYQTEELLELLDQIDEDSGKIVTSLREQADQISQKKTRNIFGVFTIISMFSAIAGIITLYDYNNHITSFDRLQILGISGGIAVFAGLLYWFIGILQLKYNLQDESQ